MANFKPCPLIVIVQTPSYGTLTWGPFATLKKATAFIRGALNDHLYATYETMKPPGMVVWAQPLYDPAFPEKEDSDG